MKKKYTATCTFAGWSTGKYDAQGREMLTQQRPEAGSYKPTAIDVDKKNADFLIISVGSKPTINWKNGKIERLKSRRALEKLQKIHNWATDF